VETAARLLPGCQSLVWDDAAQPGAAAKARMLERFLDAP